MNPRNILIAIVFSAVCSSCELTQSPLSDVPVSEPDVLRVIAEADRDVYASGSASSLLRVTLYDKHDEYVELNKGNVTVNGLPMNYVVWGQYERTTDVVNPDYNYTFTVTLSDGSQYSCRVHTPKNLNQLSVPATYDRNSPLKVTWGEIDNQALATLTFSGDTTLTFYVLASQGSVTLQPSALAKFHSGQTLTVTLTYTRSGSVDSGFMSTSSAGASFSVSRYMQI